MHSNTCVLASPPPFLTVTDTRLPPSSLATTILSAASPCGTAYSPVAESLSGGDCTACTATTKPSAPGSGLTSARREGASTCLTPSKSRTTSTPIPDGETTRPCAVLTDSSAP